MVSPARQLAAELHLKWMTGIVVNGNPKSAWLARILFHPSYSGARARFLNERRCDGKLPARSGRESSGPEPATIASRSRCRDAPAPDTLSGYALQPATIPSFPAAHRV